MPPYTLEEQIDAALTKARALASAEPDWHCLHALLGEHNRLLALLARSYGSEAQLMYRYDLTCMPFLVEPVYASRKEWLQHVYEGLTNIKNVLKRADGEAPSPLIVDGPSAP